MKSRAMLNDKLTLFYRVKDGLGMPRGPGESIHTWCAAHVLRWRGRKQRAAWVILTEEGDPWAMMARADRILRGIDATVVVELRPARS